MFKQSSNRNDPYVDRTVRISIEYAAVAVCSLVGTCMTRFMIGRRVPRVEILLVHLAQNPHYRADVATTWHSLLVTMHVITFNHYNVLIGRHMHDTSARVINTIIKPSALSAGFILTSWRVLHTHLNVVRSQPNLGPPIASCHVALRTTHGCSYSIEREGRESTVLDNGSPDDEGRMAVAHY